MLVRGAMEFFGATDEYGHGLFLATDEHGLARMKRSGGGIVSREDAKPRREMEVGGLCWYWVWVVSS